MTGKPSAFAFGDNVQGKRCCDERGMVARAGQIHEPDVAIEHDRFRLARNSGKAEARGEFAFVHHAFGGKIGVFRVMDDESIEIAGILHDAAQDPRAANRLCAIAESHSARLLQQADLGDFRALEARRQGRRRQHPHAAGIARAAQQKIDNRRLVDRRIGIGAGKDCRDAACRRRQGRGRDRLAVFGAGLADEGPHVDEAGRDAIAAAIDDLRMGGQICRHNGGANIADQAIDDQDAAGEFALRAGSINRALTSASGWWAMEEVEGWEEGEEGFTRNSLSSIGQMLRQGFQNGDPHGDAHFDLLADETACTHRRRSNRFRRHG